MMSKVIIFGLLALGVAVANAADETTDQDERVYYKERYANASRQFVNTVCPNVTDEIRDNVTNNMAEKLYHCFRYTLNHSYTINDLDWDMIELKSKYNAAEAAILFCNKTNQYVECAEKFGEIMKPCYEDAIMRHLSVLHDFACGNNGERVARFITERGVDCIEKSGKTLYRNLSIKQQNFMASYGIREIREYSRIKVETLCNYYDDIFTIVAQAFAKCTSPYPTNMAKEFSKKVKQLIGCPEAATPPPPPATTMSKILTWLGIDW